MADKELEKFKRIMEEGPGVASVSDAITQYDIAINLLRQVSGILNDETNYAALEIADMQHGLSAEQFSQDAEGSINSALSSINDIISELRTIDE